MRYLFSAVGVLVEFIEFIWYLMGEYWPVTVIVGVNLVVYFVAQWIVQTPAVREWLDQSITHLTIGQVLAVVLILYGLSTLTQRK